MDRYDIHVLQMNLSLLTFLIEGKISFRIERGFDGPLASSRTKRKSTNKTSVGRQHRYELVILPDVLRVDDDSKGLEVSFHIRNIAQSRPVNKYSKKCYSLVVKKILVLLLLILIPTFIFAMASHIEVRDDLFKSDKELANFPKTTVDSTEKDFYDKMEVYLLTGGPGTSIWENFGHAAFVLSVPKMGDISFDYGIFTFDESFYGNFILGKLYYEAWESFAAYRVKSLQEEDRTVQLLKLNLDNNRKKDMWKFLNYNVQDGNSTYLYDYFVDNCATRLRDTYNWTTDGDFRAWLESQPSPETIRESVTRYLFRSTFVPAWVLNYLLGPSVDKEITMWEACFLPDTLNAMLEEYQGTKATELYHTQHRRPVPEKWNLPLRSAFMGMILALLVFATQSKKKWLRKTSDCLLGIFYTFTFVLSSVLCFMMFFTIHYVTHGNINILIFSPLTIVPAVCHFRSMGKKRTEDALFKISLFFQFVTGIVLLLNLLLPSIIQDSISVFLPALFLYPAETIAILWKRNSSK